MEPIRKMVEWFTPEMIVIVLTGLTALTILNFLILLLTIASLSRAKKRLLAVVGKCVKLEAEQTFVQQVRQSMSNNVAHLCDVDNKIQFIEHRVDAFDSKIAETQNQLVGFEPKLREYDNLLGQAGQMMGKETAGFNQAVQRIRMLEEEFQGLRAFRRTFEQTRNRILEALNAVPVEMSSRNAPSTEQRVFKEETVSASEPRKADLEDLYKSRMHFHYP